MPPPPFGNREFFGGGGGGGTPRKKKTGKKEFKYEAKLLMKAGVVSHLIYADNENEKKQLITSVWTWLHEHKEDELEISIVKK